MKEILGVKINDLNEKQILEKIGKVLNSNRQEYIVTPNPEFLVKAQKDQEFRDILNRSYISVADGIGLIFASYFLKNPVKNRISGVDLMEKICQKAALENWPIGLYGGENNVSQKTKEELLRKYPGLRIEPRNPRIIFVALGAPKQEKWIVQNLKRMPSVRLAVGVGGAFDFISKRVKRAPRPVRKIGLEWLWRLILQPWRAKRIFSAVVVFPSLVVKSRLSTIRQFFF